MRGVHSFPSSAAADADDDIADAATDCHDAVEIEEDTNAEDSSANGSRTKTTSFIAAVLIAVVGGRR